MYILLIIRPSFWTFFNKLKNIVEKTFKIVKEEAKKIPFFHRENRDSIIVIQTPLRTRLDRTQRSRNEQNLQTKKLFWSRRRSKFFLPKQFRAFYFRFQTVLIQIVINLFFFNFSFFITNFFPYFFLYIYYITLCNVNFDAPQPYVV